MIRLSHMATKLAQKRPKKKLRKQLKPYMSRITGKGIVVSKLSFNRPIKPFVNMNILIIFSTFILQISEHKRRCFDDSHMLRNRFLLVGSDIDGFM